MEEIEFTEIMLDIETMGSSSNAPIISIGAVFFDPNTGALGSTFYREITLLSSAHYGEIDAGTVIWWMKQSDEARSVFKGNDKMTLKPALDEFSQWISVAMSKVTVEEGKTATPTIWGNGATFDNVITKNAYTATKLKAPWKHWNDRDVRTIVAMGRQILNINPKDDMVREGTFHNALDDAIFQAKYVSAIWQAFSK